MTESNKDTGQAVPTLDTQGPRIEDAINVLNSVCESLEVIESDTSSVASSIDSAESQCDDLKSSADATEIELCDARSSIQDLLVTISDLRSKVDSANQTLGQLSNSLNNESGDMYAKRVIDAYERLTGIAPGNIENFILDSENELGLVFPAALRFGSTESPEHEFSYYFGSFLSGWWSVNTIHCSGLPLRQRRAPGRSTCVADKQSDRP